MNIAVIPARGGSKRIPRKNVKPFDGRPIIAHAISAARNSNLFEHVVVSTDDAEIAAVARDFGAEIPFLRPADLASDYAATLPVIAHAVTACEALGWSFDYVCCIYPATPFIRVEDLQQSLRLLADRRADYAFPITRFPSPIQRALRRTQSDRLEPFNPQYESARTQDLEPAYYDAGQFYWGKRTAWLRGAGIHSNGVGYVIPAWRVIDIDEPDDWQRAEMMHKAFFDTSMRD